MDFNYLTMTQKVSLLLGIIFSVLAVASTFFAFKNANRIKSKVLGLFLSLILPFLAMTSWMILIFSFIDVFKNDDIMVIFVSLALCLVICLMILVIANALFQKHKNNMKDDTTEEVKATVVETNDTEVTEEPEAEESTEEEVVEEVEESVVEESETEDAESVETEDAEPVEDTIEDAEPVEEVTEEVQEEETEETEETEEPATDDTTDDDAE